MVPFDQFCSLPWLNACSLQPWYFHGPHGINDAIPWRYLGAWQYFKAKTMVHFHDSDLWYKQCNNMVIFRYNWSNLVVLSFFKAKTMVLFHDSDYTLV